MAGGDAQLNQFLHAIVVQESGGNYRALGVVTRSGDRAYGKYQIMGANIAAWSREILGRTVSIQEFLNSPKIQDQIAIGKLTGYYRQFGAAGAAVAWYAGPGNVKNRNSTKPQYGGPSIKAYADAVVARMSQMPTTPPTAGGQSYAYSAASTGGGAQVTTPGAGAGAGASQEYTMEDYGFSAAFFGSDKELKALVDRAVKEQWTPEKFAVQLKNTNWYKTKAAAEREWIQLNTSDPATAKRQKQIRTEEIRRLAVQMGANLSAQQLADLVEKSLRYGYSDIETQTNVAKLGVNYVKGKDFSGEAGRNQDQIREASAAFGVTMAEDQVARWVRDLAIGTKTEQDFDNWVKAQAKLLYPGLAEQIDQGLTVADVAQVYRRQYAEVLELNEADIDLTKDPTLRKALQFRDPNAKAGQPGIMPLWQFEESLKNDPRWLKTNNARDSLMGVAGDVLRSFGFKS